MKNIILDGKSLTIENVYEIARAPKGKIKLAISDQAIDKMNLSFNQVKRIVEKGDPVYGINTGFGALSNKHISKEDLGKLQLNLIRSHCTGVGEHFPKDVSRAIMLLRANCLITGYSGVNPETVLLLLDFLNNDVIPVIPQQGSVGASGDLAPLSHIALCLIGEGEVYYEGKLTSSKFAIEQLGKQPRVLGPKEGLALINGTAVMAATGALTIHEAQMMAKTADLTAMMTLDAVRGTGKPYHANIHSLKPHDGQLKVAKNLRKLLENSEIIDSHENCGKVQDPYSLRCIPQVHGAVRQTIDHARYVINVELNSVTDNPLLFPDEDLVLSGGNFHGEHLALCMDYLAMGLSELANISERRVEKMMNPTFSDLPAFLVEGSGLNSGLMIAHVTMAALASENKYLSHPASVDSIPTSTDKEDHVSMGVTSARKLRTVLNNLKYCLSIELLCASQGIEYHRPLKSSPAIEKAHSLIRKHVEPITEDRVFSRDIEKIHDLVDRLEILDVVEQEVELY